LRHDTFTLGAVMVSARLSIQLREDRVSLSVNNFIVCLQVVELPFDERVIVGVLVRGDEGAAPINSQPEVLHVLAALWGEHVKPVVGILESGDRLIRETDLLQDLKLGVRLTNQFFVFLLFLLCRLPRGDLTRSNLTLKSVRAGLDRHACAVEAEGEQHPPALLALVSDSELSFGSAEGVT
jgi:hypothetical protein